MTIESALKEMEYEYWCDYNHEHINEYGEWVIDENGKETNDEVCKFYL